MDTDQVILIDKPAGMTSFGVVARVRRKLSEQTGHKVRVGHTGTLDPFATGLMIILTGKMTKKSGDFLKLDKVYEATIHLGATSTTGDQEGEITPCKPTSSTVIPGRSASPSLRVSSLKTRRNSDLPKTTVDKVLRSFIGEITQTPPIYSAIRINGQRAYKLARKGEKVDMPTRKVRIYSIELLDYNYPELKIRAHVSSGTYIRTLAQDIGEKLGTGAYLARLRRIQIGDYNISQAKVLADFCINN